MKYMLDFMEKDRTALLASSAAETSLIAEIILIITGNYMLGQVMGIELSSLSRRLFLFLRRRRDIESDERYQWAKGRDGLFELVLGVSGRTMYTTTANGINVAAIICFPL